MLLLAGLMFASKNGANFDLKKIVPEYRRIYEYYRPHIERAANKYKIEPETIGAIICRESGGNADAVGTAGEIGLMQIKAGALADVNRVFRLGFSERDLFFSDRNIETGTAYLALLKMHFVGDMKKAIQAYNAGPGTVEKNPGASLTYFENIKTISNNLS